MNRPVLFGGMLLLSSAFAAAAPAITGISASGTSLTSLTDTQAITISGTGFGTSSLNGEWLGSANGFIDSLTNGARVDQQNRAGWSLLAPSTSTYPHISTERAWSNGKSIAMDVRNTTEYKQTLFYDTGSSGYSYMYTNAVIYLQHDTLASGSYLQWKMMRWTRTQTVVDGDGGYMSNRPNSTSFFSNFNTAGQTVFWFNEGGRTNLPGRGAWYRYETWVKMNSAPGVSDGVFHVKVSNPSTGAVVVDNNITNVAYNGSGNSGNLRYVVFQNYFGNAGDSGSGQADNANSVAWWDDIYISQTQARVEVCGAATWAQCTNREIQRASSWSDGSITVNLNKGALSSLSSLYLYVTDANGNVNAQGYPLAIGGSSGSSPPVPPPTFSVVPAP